MRLVTSAASSSCALAGIVEVLVDDMPADPRVAADMAERQVRRQLVEAVGRRLGQDQRIARAHRGDQPGRIIIGRRQPFAPDIVDIVEQRLRLIDLPKRRRGRRRRSGSAWARRLAPSGKRRRSDRPACGWRRAGLGERDRLAAPALAASGRLGHDRRQRHRSHDREHRQMVPTRLRHCPYPSPDTRRPSADTASNLASPSIHRMNRPD